MNRNAEKYVGKIKEQIDTEFKARRNYPRKWSKFYNQTPWDDMYNPNNLSKQLREQLKSEDLNTYQYKNEADGHFISPGMHESLLAKCRCGRKHSDLHLLRCVQNQQPKYMPEEDMTVDKLDGNKEDDAKVQLPKTSSKFIGWQKSRPQYQQWENSMKYYSPINDMPGERITTTPYNIIYIG